MGVGDGATAAALERNDRKLSTERKTKMNGGGYEMKNYLEVLSADKATINVVALHGNTANFFEIKVDYRTINGIEIGAVPRAWIFLLVDGRLPLAWKAVIIRVEMFFLFYIEFTGGHGVCGVYSRPFPIRAGHVCATRRSRAYLIKNTKYYQ